MSADMINVSTIILKSNVDADCDDWGQVFMILSGRNGSL